MDSDDYKRLLAAVLNQSFYDYIKLYHPEYRKQKYLKEAFLTSKDLVFDEDFLLENIKNNEGEPISLKEIVSVVQEHRRPDLKTMRKQLAKECVSYWNKKTVKNKIPSTINVGGYVYEVRYGESTTVDESNCFIYLEKEDPEIGNTFFKLVAKLFRTHCDVNNDKELEEHMLVLLSTNVFQWK